MKGPVRSCVACRTRRPQHALIRMRRRPDGVVVPAMSRGSHGRSAYVCPSSACFERAVKRRGLERSLGRSDGAKGRSVRVRPVVADGLWPEVLASVDQEIAKLKRSGDIGRSSRYDAFENLRRELRAPGRSA